MMNRTDAIAVLVFLLTPLGEGRRAADGKIALDNVFLLTPLLKNLSVPFLAGGTSLHLREARPRLPVQRRWA